MKKLKSFLSASIVILSVQMTHAQLINPGFETWSQNFLVPTAMDPNSGSGTTGWWDYNYFNYSLMGGSPISVTRCSDTVRTGNYSVRLQTVVYTSTSWNLYNTWGIPFIGHQYNDTLGILFNGNVNFTTQVFKPGIPCTQSLTQFKFYYQYRPVGNDTAECRVELRSAGTLVAGGWFKTNVPTGNSGWQQAVVNFTYVNALTPDTLYILFSSSSLDRSPKAGSVMWIDDASVVLPTGVEQSSNEENAITLFPNPSNGIFSLQQNPSNAMDQTIEVYNMIGELIYQSHITSAETSLDLSSQPSGMYFYRIMENEKISSSGKIIIQ